jgi:PERQ amino acid-rich with GYF domain-containing protein
MIIANLSLVDDFVQTLLSLPAEPEILADSVYANSQTLDGRRFAEEFIRRRKLADKGIIDPSSSGTLSNVGNDGKASSGWNEVAKKGPVPKEDNSNSAFKVVAAKKKGKR